MNTCSGDASGGGVSSGTPNKSTQQRTLLPDANTPSSSGSMRSVGKRCAEENGEGRHPKGSSTPSGTCAKKPFLESDRTPLSVVGLNVSGTLNRSSCSSREQTLCTTATTTLRISRGLQTTGPETANRYCQVTSTRVPKRTWTVAVQTDAVFVQSEPPAPSPAPVPEKVPQNDACCQTDEPAVQEACVGTSQHVINSSTPVVRLADGWCQTTIRTEKDQSTVAVLSVPPVSSTPSRDTVPASGGTPTVDSFATMLNNLAKEFGIDLSAVETGSPQDTVSRNKKRGPKQQSAVVDQEHLPYDELVKKTSAAVAAMVERKMSTIMNARLAAYDETISAKRDKFIAWTKRYQTRQQQLEANIRMQAPRRVIMVRRRLVAAKRPKMKESAVQCDEPVVTKSPKEAVTVGTQWQRQKLTVTNAKRKPAPTRTTTTGTKMKSKISTDPLPGADETKPPTAAARKGSMRQTKLSNYTEAVQQQLQQDQPKPTRQRQQQQQRKCSSKLPVTVSPTPRRPSCSSRVTTTATTTTTDRAKKNGSKSSKESKVERRGATKATHAKERTPPDEEIHVEETPSESSDEEACEKKHYPYRTPQHYPSQCTKSTETSFLTPTKTRDVAQGTTPTPAEDGGHRINRVAFQDGFLDRVATQSVLLSPMGRMYVGPVDPRPIDRSHYGTFLVPTGPPAAGDSDTIPPTPQNVMYVNRPERRLFVRTKRPSVGGVGAGLVREKHPDISIVSSQQLYSQIGLAVEKALKDRKIPKLDTMYGEPSIEVFNGSDAGEKGMDDGGTPRAMSNGTSVTGGGGGGGSAFERKNRFVCSSANDDYSQRGEGAQHHHQFGRQSMAPFHNDRSPSLSPIVYRDDDSEDEIC